MLVAGWCDGLGWFGLGCVTRTITRSRCNPNSAGKCINFHPTQWARTTRVRTRLWTTFLLGIGDFVRVPMQSVANDHFWLLLLGAGRTLGHAVGVAKPLPQCDLCARPFFAAATASTATYANHSLKRQGEPSPTPIYTRTHAHTRLQGFGCVWNSAYVAHDLLKMLVKMHNTLEKKKTKIKTPKASRQHLGVECVTIKYPNFLPWLVYL